MRFRGDDLRYIERYTGESDYFKDKELFMIRVYTRNFAVLWGRMLKFKTFIDHSDELRKIIRDANKKDWRTTKLQNTLDKFYIKYEGVPN